MTAYDYTNQEWIEGEPARQLLLSQLQDEITLLTSPDGDAYAKLIGANRKELLTSREADLLIIESPTT